MLEPAGIVLRRPILLQPGSDQLPQLLILRELARLRPQCAIPGALVCGCGAISPEATIAPQLAADGRGCAVQLGSNRSQRHAGRNASRDLLAIIQAQHPAGTVVEAPAAHTAMRLQVGKDRCVPSANDTADQIYAFAPLPAVPHFRTIRGQYPSSSLRRRITSPRSRYQCCVDLLRPPPK